MLKLDLLVRFFNGGAKQRFLIGKWIMASLMVGGLLFSWSPASFSKQVTLAWDANTERSLGGYRIYYGLASRSYVTSVDVGNQTSYTLSGLEEGWTYYFAVTAYNVRKTFESDFSNEVNTGFTGPVKAQLESPSEGSYESGIGLIRGWVCNATKVEVEIDGGLLLKAAYGSPRPDAQAICGAADTGFGLIHNWSSLGDGLHTLRVLADGVEVGRASFNVTTFGQPYMTGLSGDYVLPDFPRAGDQVAVRWSELYQNFVIVGASVNSASIQANFMADISENASLLALQESPKTGSFESGIGFIRGWACNASAVEIQIDGGARLKAGYGTPRPDTAASCGHANTGYGLVFNWNSLSAGTHTLKAFADGVEFANATYTVTTLGQDFLRNLPPYQHTLINFPSTGRNTTLRWSEPHQNFVIVRVR